MAEYKPTIGLEVHAELKTRTKMFCDSLNDPEEKHPNTNICPVCTGQPGALPTVNKQAVEAVLKIGMALNGEIPQFSKFDRKNYVYPDLPKGYQISQYDLPLIFGGVLNGVQLRRIHLEEDTGRLLHYDNDDNNDKKGHGQQPSSLVDFNRAGVPLMELVTEPDIHSAEQAVAFAKELQLILRYLGISDADMEKGQMRIEANISLQPEIPNFSRHLSGGALEGGIPPTAGQSSISNKLGTKVEVKNINSFKAVHDAIEYEIKRQTEVLESGKKVVQETRGWDDVKKVTVSQRLKEEAHDYRYFPEPDLPPLDMSKFDLKALKLAIPELPQEKRLRLAKEYFLTAFQVELLVTDSAAAEYFEKTVSEIAAEDGTDIKSKAVLAFNYLTSDLKGLMAGEGFGFTDLKIDPEDFGDLILMVHSKKLSSRSAKDVLAKMLETGLDPRKIVEEESLGQVSDEAQLQTAAEKVIKENPTAVTDYKKGKTNALQFLVGKAMAELRGRGNPEILRKLIEKAIL